MVLHEQFIEEKNFMGEDFIKKNKFIDPLFGKIAYTMWRLKK